MTKLFLSALLALAPALPAAAQVRAVATVAPAIYSAPAAIAPVGAAALVPSLSASSISLLPSAPSLSAPALMPSLVPSILAPLPALPAAAISAAPALAAMPAARFGDHAAPPSVALSAANPAALDRAPPSGKAQPLVLHSLQDLHLLSENVGGSAAGAAAFDGQLATGKPAVVPGMPGVVVRSVNGGLGEFQAHEVATIRKIQVFTPDLKVLVREQAATPDLIVNGVVTELKSVHKGVLDKQLAHANHQLVSHAKRHGLGLGAVVLDVIGPSLTTAQIEDKIAQVVREEAPIGFARVYVFHGSELKTYAPAADGVFRLDASAIPFSPLAAKTAPAAAVPSAASFVMPSALAKAVLPDMTVLAREVQEPSRLLQARGIEATIAMYGSARILSPEKAQAKLAAVVAEFGRKPKGKEAKAKMAEAREAVVMSKYYQIARELGALIAQEGKGKVAVVTGGGPGIMEGGMRGAFEAGGPAVGYNIKLPHEQNPNPYATPGLEFTFDHFPTRQMAMRHGSMGLVYFPGGFGTMYELFEILTLMQTGKMPRAPIVLIGERAYWDHILNFDEFAHMGLISPNDLSMFTFAENAPQAWAAIRAAHTAPAVVAR